MNEKRYLLVLLNFYRRVSGRPAETLADIPPDQLAFLAGMDYLDMLRPLLVEALRGGASLLGLADYYGINRATVRRLRDQYVPTGQRQAG